LVYSPKKVFDQINIILALSLSNKAAYHNSTMEDEEIRRLSLSNKATYHNSTMEDEIIRQTKKHGYKGHIRESVSPCATLVLVAPKRDGMVHVFVLKQEHCKKISFQYTLHG
jgi:hypothetical protein